jgi:hypothetical protein
MKHILSLILGITLAVYGSVAMADDTTTIWLTKTSSDNVVKVCTASKCLGNIPITYADDATWASAKDSYDVSPATLAALESKGGVITIHGDSGISVTCTKKSSKK